MKEACTVTSPFIVTLQVLPETVVHPDPQPRKLLPLLGVAVSATDELDGKVAVHVAPQLIPEGELTIVPSVAPALISIERLLVAVPCGQPWLAGPCTVTVMVPTWTFPPVLPSV